jgi:hypothetical protein
MMRNQPFAPQRLELPSGLEREHPWGRAPENESKLMPYWIPERGRESARESDSPILSPRIPHSVQKVCRRVTIDVLLGVCIGGVAHPCGRWLLATQCPADALTKTWVCRLARPGKKCRCLHAVKAHSTMGRRLGPRALVCPQ